MKSKIIGITLIVIILIATTIGLVIAIRKGKLNNRKDNRKPSPSGVVLYMQTKNPVALTL